MKIWAIADLHLPFGNPKKSMEVFGEPWINYPKKIKANWEERVSAEDLVLIAGDISWAMNLEDALKDLDFIDALPGEKLIIRGNHDYWWPSPSKLRGLLPPTIHFIQNTAFHFHDIAFGGVRLWDTHEYNFDEVIEFVENPYARKKSREELEREREEGEKIFTRELERLKLSLSKMDQRAKHRIALTHYPPIGKDLRPSRAGAILEDFNVEICVFGHLHHVKDKALPFGTARGVRYILTSADYLGFAPIMILD